MPTSQYPCFDLIIQGCLNVNVSAPCTPTTTTLQPPITCDQFWYVDCSPCDSVVYTDEASAFAHVPPEGCGPCTAQLVQGINCNGCENPTMFFEAGPFNCEIISVEPSNYSITQSLDAWGIEKTIDVYPNATPIVENVTVNTTCGNFSVSVTGIYNNGSCESWIS